MPKIIILYWQPGSCGDFVQSLFLNNDACQGVVENFCLGPTGRIHPTIKSQYKINFHHEPNRWYWRAWSITDCERLRSMVEDQHCDFFVVPTHDLDQVNFLKQQFDNSVSVGISYPENLFPFVLKNVCKKVFSAGPELDKFYNDPIHQCFKNKKIFGEFVFKQQIRFGSAVNRSVDPKFDVNIFLEKILVNDFSDFDQQPVKKDPQSISYWLEHQNKLHRFCYNIGPTLQSILGFNTLSVNLGDIGLELDKFDQIAILEFCKSKNIFVSKEALKTLHTANNFLESLVP